MRDVVIKAHGVAENRAGVAAVGDNNCQPSVGRLDFTKMLQMNEGIFGEMVGGAQIEDAAHPPTHRRAHGAAMLEGDEQFTPCPYAAETIR